MVSQFVYTHLCFVMNVVFVKILCHEEFVFYGKEETISVPL